MSHQPNHIYEFGPFRLDVAERMLMRDGEAIPLQPKAFDLLHVLVEHHGHLLEKDELLKVVWPDTIVEEVNLANNISVLRKALGEDGNGQRFIETVPRRGYRFVAGVSQIQHATVEEEPPIARPVAEPLSPTAPPAASDQSGQWRRLALALTGSGTIIIAIVAWFYFNRSPGLTSQDIILLADFENRTGDAIFDGMLKQGLAIQLRQSPFLNLFPEPMVRQTLREMKRPPDARVTAEAAWEICQRHDLKALIAGSIAPLGSHYVITLEAINGQSGESLAHEQVEAESREKVLQALSQAATQLRGKLGESLGSIQRFDKPLQQATTSKLEAFKAWSLGIERSYSGNMMEAIPLYKRAVLMLSKGSYPRQPGAPTDLALTYNMIGQYDQAVAQAHEAIRLNRNFAPAHRTLGWALLPLNRFAEARDALTQALQQNLDTPDFHAILYQIAFTDGVTAGMQQQIEWARGKPNEYIAFDWQTGAAAFAGQWRKAQEFSGRAIDLAARGEAKEVAARYATEQALRVAVFGDCQQARANAAQGLKLTRGRVSLPRAALALALCGAANQAQGLVEEIGDTRPSRLRAALAVVPALAFGFGACGGDHGRCATEP